MEYLEYMKRESIAGASAGVVGTVLGYPLDVIKTRQQVSNVSIPKAIQTIYRESGLMGYYRGMVAPLVSLTLLNTLNFSTYSFTKNGLNVPDQFDVTKDGFHWKVGIAGASVGPLSSLISTPFELIKTQMQLRNSSLSEGQTKYRNSIHAAISITKEHGVSALYRAFAVNTTREMVFLATYFTVYEHVKSFQVHAMSLYPASVAVPLAGGTAGAMGWLVSYPLDCIKSNIQAKPIDGITKVPSAMQVAKYLINTKGFLGLYAGVIPSILRAFIVSSSRFSAYETTMWLLTPDK